MAGQEQLSTQSSLMKLMLCTLFLISSSAFVIAKRTDESMISKVEASIVEKTNQLRQEAGLPAVEANEELTDTAMKFATFMAETDKYGHQADGQTPAQRARKAGYDYCVVRENIAYRVNTGEVTSDGLTDAFVQGWIDSPEHRENMLADYVVHTGVAVATTDDESYYAVQMFGRPKSAAIQLKLTNESSGMQAIVIESNDSSDEIEMPARSVLTMSRCFPATLRMKDHEETIRLKSSTELIVTDQGITRKK